MQNGQTMMPNPSCSRNTLSQVNRVGLTKHSKQNRTTKKEIEVLTRAQCKHAVGLLSRIQGINPTYTLVTHYSLLVGAHPARKTLNTDALLCAFHRYRRI